MLFRSLLTGEPGTGVELCAKFVHSPTAPWVAPDNLSVLAEAPLELLEKAREGSLFLHEVGDLNRMEQKGLMLLLGKVEKYNARLICASAKPLADQVAQGSFDARLYSAIATVALHVPNLREHREDIPDLANLYLLRCIEEIGRAHV